MENQSSARSGGSWTQIIVCGLLAGAIINAVEFIAHRVWLDAQWNAAFAALGKTPSFWGTFVVANFAVGIVAVWTYRWLARFYGSGRATALKAAAGIWIVFWLIPVMGLQPFDFFPNFLIAMVILVGIVDVAAGVLPAIRLYERLSRT